MRHLREIIQRKFSKQHSIQQANVFIAQSTGKRKIIDHQPFVEVKWRNCDNAIYTTWEQQSLIATHQELFSYKKASMINLLDESDTSDKESTYKILAIYKANYLLFTFNCVESLFYKFKSHIKKNIIEIMGMVILNQGKNSKDTFLWTHQLKQILTFSMKQIDRFNKIFTPYLTSEEHKCVIQDLYKSKMANEVKMEAEEEPIKRYSNDQKSKMVDKYIRNINLQEFKAKLIHEQHHQTIFKNVGNASFSKIEQNLKSEDRIADQKDRLIRQEDHKQVLIKQVKSIQQNKSIPDSNISFLKYKKIQKFDKPTLKKNVFFKSIHLLKQLEKTQRQLNNDKIIRVLSQQVNIDGSYAFVVQTSSKQLVINESILIQLGYMNLIQDYKQLLIVYEQIKEACEEK